MTLNTKFEGNTCIIEIEGSIDALTAQTLEQAVRIPWRIP